MAILKILLKPRKKKSRGWCRWQHSRFPTLCLLFFLPPGPCSPYQPAHSTYDVVTDKRFPIIMLTKQDWGIYGGVTAWQKCQGGSNHGTSFCGLTMTVIPYPIHVIGKVTNVKHCMVHATLCFILQLRNWPSILNTKISKHSQLWNPVRVIWWGCKPEIIWPSLTTATAVGYNNTDMLLYFEDAA